MKMTVCGIRREGICLFFRIRREAGVPPIREGCLAGTVQKNGHTPDPVCRLAAWLSAGPAEGAEGLEQELCLNVTNAGNCRCMAPGSYGLFVFSDETLKKFKSSEKDLTETFSPTLRQRSKPYKYTFSSTSPA